MSLSILKQGMLTTIQDLGRTGFQKFGVIAGGSMDPFALAAANLLVGNDRGEAALEMTVLGDTILFETDALIAVCGADLSPVIEGSALPLWRAVVVRQGSTLHFATAKRLGCRAYVAVAGGFDIPFEMGSQSTYLRAGIGGFHGRALKKGDRLGVREPSETSLRIMHRLSAGKETAPFAASALSITRHMRPSYSANPVVRVLRGKEYDLFDEESHRLLFHAEFKVLPESDRMGYRLKADGPALRMKERRDMISEAVTFGTIQVPPDGNPIVLMADRQTTGGYPKIAQVISVDLPLLGQLSPGAQIRFQETTMEEAQDLYMIRELELQALKQGIYIHSL